MINTIRKILYNAGIQDDIISVTEPHRWVMESRKIYLSSGSVLLLRAGINDEWTNDAAILNQVHAASMLRDCGLSQPCILAYSADKAEYGFRFLLSEAYTGVKLLDMYSSSDQDGRIELFESLGFTYGKIHSIKNDWSGVWNGSPDKSRYPLHPAEFYSMAEINGGSGRALYDRLLISKDFHDEICRLWDSSLIYLKNRESSLVHMSPFPWSIYLSNERDGYMVTSLAALGDFMWWDPMSDVAHLLHPPFMDITDAERDAFIKHYSLTPDFKAVSLYRLLNRICAISNVYMAPISNEIQLQWINREIAGLPELVESILAYVL